MLGVYSLTSFTKNTYKLCFLFTCPEQFSHCNVKHPSDYIYDLPFHLVSRGS